MIDDNLHAHRLDLPDQFRMLDEVYQQLQVPAERLDLVDDLADRRQRRPAGKHGRDPRTARTQAMPAGDVLFRRIRRDHRDAANPARLRQEDVLETTMVGTKYGGMDEHGPVDTEPIAHLQVVRQRGIRRRVVPLRRVRIAGSIEDVEMAVATARGQLATGGPFRARSRG